MQNMSRVLTCQLTDMPSLPIILSDIGFEYDVHTNASTNAKYGREYVRVAYVMPCLESAKT